MEWKRWIMGLGLFVAIASGLDASAPDTVSPGQLDRVVEVAGSCPTFSWGAVEGTEFYELVVSLSADPAMEPAVVIRQEISGRALSWTPAVESCLEPEVEYAWVVRAHGAKGVGEWSEMRLFRVARLPSLEEIREALAVLRLERPGPPAGNVSGSAASRIAGPVRDGANGSPTAVTDLGGAALALAADGSFVGNAFVFSCGQAATDLFYLDADDDNFGDAANSARACVAPTGYVGNSLDCDDSDSGLAQQDPCGCDPFNPAAVCGVGSTRCSPSAAADGICSSDPVGSGTQGQSCSVPADCAFDHVCITSLAGTMCSRWCRLALGDSDCIGISNCTALSPSVFIDADEWGVCLPT